MWEEREWERNQAASLSQLTSVHWECELSAGTQLDKNFGKQPNAVGLSDEDENTV